MQDEEEDDDGIYKDIVVTVGFSAKVEMKTFMSGQKANYQRHLKKNPNNTIETFITEFFDKAANDSNMLQDLAKVYKGELVEAKIAQELTSDERFDVESSLETAEADIIDFTEAAERIRTERQRH